MEKKKEDLNEELAGLIKSWIDWDAYHDERMFFDDMLDDEEYDRILDFVNDLIEENEIELKLFECELEMLSTDKSVFDNYLKAKYRNVDNGNINDKVLEMKRGVEKYIDDLSTAKRLLEELE